MCDSSVRVTTVLETKKGYNTATPISSEVILFEWIGVMHAVLNF